MGPAKPADPKATPVGAPPAGPPKPTDPKANIAPLPPPPPEPKIQAPPPEQPVPPEIDAMAKTLSGTWKCKGDEWDDKGGKGPLTATNKIKLELDNWWISETLEVKGQRTVKLLAYSTYDTLSKKWRRVLIMNRGSQITGTSDGMTDGKLTWNMALIGPMGSAQLREAVDASDLKAGLKLAGDFSRDRGKTWHKVYELTCKK